ncbi:phosphoenolpyruvate carboxylase [Escherichia coli]|uniref:Phosphoenolpyruvate carboxylase n=1 Tax=Escherichia coli TaxID=562 RepID=A0A376TZ59_ECOLX|nr:phosphoenolpyruvate carboxylase [Escherichia coli]
MNCQSSPAISTVATYVKTKILCLTSAPLRRNKNWANCRWVHVRRNVAPTGGVESLRAIPWIFAWTQNRLMLPAWLGAGTALQKVVEDGKQSELEAMCRDWPFFSTRLGMLEMVFAKADLWLAEYYDQRLVDKALWPLGKELRNLQEETSKWCWRLPTISHLMGRSAVDCRVYSATEYLHRPAERIAGRVTLHRSRQAEKEGQEPDPRVEQALMVTIAGIAAGMRNTG